MENEQAAARAALESVATVKRARAARVRTPAWAWHAQGLVFVIIGAAIMLPDLPRMLLVLASAIIGGIVAAALKNRTGFNPVHRNSRDWVAPLAIAVPVLIVAAISWTVGFWLHLTWIALIVGFACYFTVVVVGPMAERRAAH